MKIISLALISLLLAACSSTGYSPRFHYNYIYVANLTGSTISNVALQVGERDLRCDTVDVNKICDQRFATRPYPQQAMQLSWEDGDGKQQSQQLNPTIPATMAPSVPLHVALDIHADGSVSTNFRQDGLY